MRAGKVVAKEAIVQSLTSLEDILSDNAIEQYVSRLRRRLAAFGLNLRTVRGIGYLLERPGDLRMKPYSLRRRLLLWLLLATAILGLLALVDTWREALRTAQGVSDRVLVGLGPGDRRTGDAWTKPAGWRWTSPIPRWKC